MKLVENISTEELANIKRTIGEAFVTNELFHEFGTVEERREAVIKYMDCYVQYVYEAKSLYQNESGTAYIGVCYSKEEQFWPQIKMLWGILRAVPFKKLRRMLKQINENTAGNKVYTRHPYIEVLMVCVKKEAQGKGYSHELVDFAKEMAKSHHCPLLFDTDMKAYADIYQHFGCELYHQCTASNGVTRYNLVWEESFDSGKEAVK
jgi:GNAT superfamily N-acetyltransferase